MPKLSVKEKVPWTSSASASASPTWLIVVRTTWSPAKPSSWRGHYYGRMLVFEGLTFLNAQVPSLPILFVFCGMGQLLQGHGPPFLPIPSIHPSAQFHQACPSSFWRVRELYLEIWHLWGPGKCFASFSGAGRWSARSWVKSSTSCLKEMNLLCSYLGSLGGGTKLGLQQALSNH